MKYRLSIPRSYGRVDYLIIPAIPRLWVKPAVGRSFSLSNRNRLVPDCQGRVCPILYLTRRVPRATIKQWTYVRLKYEPIEAEKEHYGYRF
jgi:hypothetical protein